MQPHLLPELPGQSTVGLQLVSKLATDSPFSLTDYYPICYDKDVGLQHESVVVAWQDGKGSKRTPAECAFLYT